MLSSWLGRKKEFTLESHVHIVVVNFMPWILRFCCVFFVLIHTVDQCLLSSLYKCESVLCVVVGCTKKPLYYVKFVRIFHVLHLWCYAIWLKSIWNEGKQYVASNSSNLWVRSNMIFHSYLWEKHTIKCIDELVLSDNKSQVAGYCIPRGVSGLVCCNGNLLFIWFS